MRSANLLKSKDVAKAAKFSPRLTHLPRGAVGGTAITMEGSCEYFDKQSRTADKGWPYSLGVE